MRLLGSLSAKMLMQQYQSRLTRWSIYNSVCSAFQWEVYTCRNRKPELIVTKLQHILRGKTCLNHCYYNIIIKIPCLSSQQHILFTTQPLHKNQLTTVQCAVVRLRQLAALQSARLISNLPISREMNLYFRTAAGPTAWIKRRRVKQDLIANFANIKSSPSDEVHGPEVPLSVQLCRREPGTTEFTKNPHTKSVQFPPFCVSPRLGLPLVHGYSEPHCRVKIKSTSR